MVDGHHVYPIGTRDACLCFTGRDTLPDVGNPCGLETQIPPTSA